MEIARRDIVRLGIGFSLLGMGTEASAGIARPSEAILAHVDPELREAARAMLREEARTWSNATLREIRSHAPAPAPWRVDVPVQERHIPGAAGQPPLTVYVINARDGGALRPGILHTHGGGFVVGTARFEIPYLQGIARDLDCVIVTVEYRLAPETVFAGSIEDNYRGLEWMCRNSDALGVDRARVVAMGESAGGGHAALLALAARDRGAFALAGQVLVYPMLDDRTGSSRMQPPFIGAVGWKAQANRFGWQSFLGRAPGGRDVPSAAVPARRRDLAGLPRTFIGVGGIDLFVDEDIDYARRLTEAGVATDLLVVPRAFHGFDRVAPDSGPARRFNKAKYDFLRRIFDRSAAA